MGMNESNSRYDLLTLENLDKLKEVKNLEDHPNKDSLIEICKVSREAWWDGLQALFPTTTTMGELSTEMDDEEEDEDDQVFEKFSDFMKEGGCKDSFSALVDCLESTPSMAKCKEHLPILKNCMDAHISHYEPILALAKSTEEKTIAFATELKQKDDLAAMNQPQPVEGVG